MANTVPSLSWTTHMELTDVWSIYVAWDKNSDTGRKERARETWWQEIRRDEKRENTWRMTLRDEISRQDERRSEQKYERRRSRSILQPEYQRVFFLSEICWLKQRMLFNCVVIVCWCLCGWDCCRCCRYDAWGSPSLLFCCRLCSCLNIRVPVCQGLLAVALKIRFFGIYLCSLNPQLCDGFCFFACLENIQSRQNFM